MVGAPALLTSSCYTPHMETAVFRLTLALLLCVSGCSSTPSNFFTTPKELQLDGNRYLACTGVIWLYNPSRGIADSSKKMFEFTFIDEYGQDQDIKEVSSYTIREAPEATFATPYSMPGPDVTKYSNGQPFITGNLYLFGQGKGRSCQIYGSR